MNSIESPIVLSSPHTAGADSLYPALSASDPVALKALRTLISPTPNLPLELNQSPLSPSSSSWPEVGDALAETNLWDRTTASGSLPAEDDALQVLREQAESISGVREPVSHFISAQNPPFASSPTSVLPDSLVADMEVTVAPEVTYSSPPGEYDAELSSESPLPDPGLIEALRELLGHPAQASPAAQTISIRDEEKDSGSRRVLEIVQSLLSEETLSAASLPLLIQVRDVLSPTKGELNHQPEALAQIRALIETLPSEAVPAPVRHPIQTNEPPLAVPLEDSSDFTPALEQPEQETPNLGQVILQSLDTQSSTSAANAVAAVNQPAHLERVEQFSALITEMADRVLVTDPLHGQTQEVRIQLAESVMPGTEVRVWREEGGQLRVDFDTTSGYWARVLNEASPLLAQRLNERLNLPDAVLVNVQQQGGQPEDGRSRNRHTPWDMTGQEASQ